MSLTDNFGSGHHHHHFSPLRLFTKKPYSSPPTISSSPFEETLIFGLKSLPELPSSPSVPLSWLASAVDLLSSTLSSAASLLSDPSLAGSDPAALSDRLDSSASLLDAANAVSAEISRLSSLRLRLRLALHLLSSPDAGAGAVSRARDLIAEYQPRSGRKIISGEIEKLRSSQRAKASAVRRAIVAVESVSALVVGAVLAAFGEKPDLSKVRATAEFSWAEAFNKILTAVDGKIESVVEIEAVDFSVKNLTAVMDDGSGDDELKKAVVDTEEKTEELAEGLDRLDKAVDGMFRAALLERKAALQSFRFGGGPTRCRYTERV